MSSVSPIFRKAVTQVWYVLSMAAFFLAFAAFYKPFGMERYLDMDRGLLFFNITIMMCIITGCLSITRVIFFLDRKQITRDWWGYLAWCVFEMVVISFFLALYVTLMDKHAEPYFAVLSTCFKYTFSILIYPYTILTLIFEILGSRATLRQDGEDDALIKFTDANRQVKLVVKKAAVLYISAEENYVRIHYQDGDKIKEFLLRATMRSIEPVTSEYGLFRCHRSYYINPRHIKALRKDRYEQITADMDFMGISIPVSRKTYAELSALI